MFNSDPNAVGRRAPYLAAGGGVPLRALTEAEGKVIAVLLGGSGTSERERLSRIQIPRSTYHAARKRAYEEGWLTDRYVPDPAGLGRPRVTFTVVRPYVDRLPEVVAAWTGDASNMLTWASPQVVLGVFFREEIAPKRKERPIVQEGWSRWTFELTVDIRGPSVPVYFDYEGMWSHLAELAGTSTYPTGLGGLGGEDGGALLTDHQRWAVRELVVRPFVASTEGRASHLVGPLGLPFSQRRMLKQGRVVHRVLLDAGKVPPLRGRGADQVTLVMGEFKAGVRPETLFGTLTRECRVFPFLYATDGHRLLLGALGRGSSTPSVGLPSTESRRPVLPTLQESLQGIEIIAESAAGFRPAVDHRYDRLFPDPAARG